jgi:hypothetical protein
VVREIEGGEEKDGREPRWCTQAEENRVGNGGRVVPRMCGGAAGVRKMTAFFLCWLSLDRRCGGQGILNNRKKEVSSKKSNSTQLHPLIP